MPSLDRQLYPEVALWINLKLSKKISAKIRRKIIEFSSDFCSFFRSAKRFDSDELLENKKADAAPA